LKRFKALTLGHAIIMGRKTHESIGKPLPGRRNIIVTRGLQQFAGCEVVSSLEAALKLVEQDELPFIIGGAQLYAEALPKVTHLFLTRIDRDVEADAFFPPLEENQWREVNREAGTTPGVTFVDLLRREG
jgi:dihydrofolate reductase